jgi:hypothetical protein
MDDAAARKIGREGPALSLAAGEASNLDRRGFGALDRILARDLRQLLELELHLIEEPLAALRS